VTTVCQQDSEYFYFIGCAILRKNKKHSFAGKKCWKPALNEQSQENHRDLFVKYLIFWKGLSAE